MYTIHQYGDMMADQGRVEAYARAIRARVTPASAVLDLGAGPGMMTLLACQAGARKVYAVEPNGIIEVARDLVAANEYADRVEFLEDVSTAIDLPERVDVIVSDLRGVLPLHLNSLPSVLDARDRFLKPHGALIPTRDIVWVAVVAAPELHARIASPWDEALGLDYAAGRRLAVNAEEKWRGTPASLVVEPQVWSDLEYATLARTQVNAGVTWIVEHERRAHGLCLWFDTETAPGCGFSNSPGSAEVHVYGQMFLPWVESWSLQPGDRIAAEIRADIVGDDYVWSWNTEIRGSGGDGPVKARFRQSQFQGAPISSDRLRKSNSSFLPTLNRDGAVDRLVLDLMATGIDLEAISHQVTRQFPDRFSDWRKALARVGELSTKYSV